MTLKPIHRPELVRIATDSRFYGGKLGKPLNILIATSCTLLLSIAVSVIMSLFGDEPSISFVASFSIVSTLAVIVSCISHSTYVKYSYLKPMCNQEFISRLKYLANKKCSTNKSDAQCAIWMSIHQNNRASPMSLHILIRWLLKKSIISSN